jgi:hypothetical protein
MSLAFVLSTPAVVEGLNTLLLLALRVLLLQSGGLQQLLDLLESKQINLQHNAAFALYGLSDNEDNIPCIIQAGGLQRLYDCSEKLQVQASKVSQGPKLKACCGAWVCLLAQCIYAVDFMCCCFELLVIGAAFSKPMSLLHIHEAFRAGMPDDSHRDDRCCCCR